MRKTFTKPTKKRVVNTPTTPNSVANMTQSQDKNTQIGVRIAQLRKQFGISQQEFAARTGLGRDSIANWETGRAEPIAATLTVLADEFNVNLHWLLTGQGGMFLGAEPERTAARERQAELVPVFGRVKAGPDGMYLEDHPEYYVPRPPGVDDANVFGVEVRGDSGEPRYKAGDILLCVEEKEPHTGGDYVVILPEGDCVLKRWQTAGGDAEGRALVRLLSWNADYTPLVYRRDQIKSVARPIYLVWGSVAWKLKIAPEEAGVARDGRAVEVPEAADADPVDALDLLRRENDRLRTRLTRVSTSLERLTTLASNRNGWRSPTIEEMHDRLDEIERQSAAKARSGRPGRKAGGGEG